MSENYTTDHELEDSVAEQSLDSALVSESEFSPPQVVVNSDGADSDGSFVNLRLRLGEESNGSTRSDSSVDALGSPVDDGAGTSVGSREELLIGGSHHQETSSVQVGPVDGGCGASLTMDGSEQGDSDEVRVTEDGGKEDMFVDAPEELSVYDGRNPAVEGTETYESLEEQHSIQETHFQIPDSGDLQVHHLMGELIQLRATLDKTAGEKEIIARECKEERERFSKELVNICHQLKRLTYQQSVLDEHGNEEEIRVSDNPMEGLMSECSEILKSAVEERLQTEGTIRELNAILFTKDQEIEELNANLIEHTVSRDVVASYLNSASQEKDRHIEDVASRMLDSLATVVYQEELLDHSLISKIFHVEQSTSMLLQNYNWLLSEIYQLRQCLMECSSDLGVPEDFGAIFFNTRNILLEFKKKEGNLVEQLSHLEDENRRNREIVSTVNVEVEKLKLELEQEKAKYASVKEKLSLAVTRGKQLVQQRDSLKQSLADKTTDLEKSLIELQEKSRALEEALSRRDTLFQTMEEVLSQIDVPEGLELIDMVEKIRWLVEDRDSLKSVSIEFHKLSDAISSIDLLESVSSVDLESRINLLRDSVQRSKDEYDQLQVEIAGTREATRNEIDHLTTLILAETQEKDFLQKELEVLTNQYNDVVTKEHLVSLEKDQLVRMLVETSGVDMDDERVNQSSSDIILLAEKCIGMIKEQTSAAFKCSDDVAETFETIKSSLYVRNQDLVLCERILEEEMLNRSDVHKMSEELRVASQEVLALKEEKQSLQNDLEKSEEKCASVREKLSMAIKKGKGVVQEQKNTKQLLDEKVSEIEKLRLQLQQQESEIRDSRSQINKLSTDVECIPKLEAELVEVRDRRDQLEQFLSESNIMLQRVIEAIDGIVLPVDSVFEEPVEKVKWFAEYLSECHVAKAQAKEEFEKTKVEASNVAEELEGAYITMKSLEDALSSAESNISRLAEEKREVEVGKASVEQELQKAMHEATSLATKFEEACATRKLLEDAISLAENKVSLLISEKDDAQVTRAFAGAELEKMKQEVTGQASKLSEAYATIKSLKDSLSLLEADVALLEEQKNAALVGKTSLEDELKKLEEEAGSQLSKLEDAHSTIKSLEDNLLEAEKNISLLAGEKNIAEQKIMQLNSELTASIEEFAGARGSLESRSVELYGHLRSFCTLLKDEALFSLVRRGFEKNVESLKHMDLLLVSIMDHFVRMGSEPLQKHPFMEEGSYMPDIFPAVHENVVNLEILTEEGTTAESDKILSYFKEMVEKFHSRNKILSDLFVGFSSTVDEISAALIRELQATKDQIILLVEHVESLNLQVKTQDSARALLEDDMTTLLSACTQATQQLQMEVENDRFSPASGDAAAEKVAEKLLFVTREVQSLIKHFENIKHETTNEIDDLRERLQEAQTTSEKAIGERDLKQSRVSELETNVEALQNLCSEMRLELEEYQAKEMGLKDREVELPASNKEQEAEETLMTASQAKLLFDKISGIDIPSTGPEVGDLEPQNLAHVNKILYIIDRYTELKHQVNLISHDKEELQSSLTTQVYEMEHLKEELEKHKRNKQDSEKKTKSELSELTSDLEKLIQKLEGTDLVAVQYSGDVTEIVSVLEKRVMGLLLESESAKSKAQELDVKLRGSHKVVDELSTKVKLLEDSIQGSAVLPGTSVQERSIFEASSRPSESEISEIEDGGSIGNKAVTPVPSATHVRTMRKGSTDHLALDVDLESDRLINNGEISGDKGHLFKSLNMSGLIPRQGKMFADRVDGFWVSSGRVLMSRPRARLGLIAYWLLLHIWILGTIL